MSGIGLCRILLCIYLAAPTLGANAGGALSTALCSCSREGRRPDWQPVDNLAIAILIACSGRYLRIGGSQSHIGRVCVCWLAMRPDF